MIKFLKSFQVLCSSSASIWGGSTSNGLGMIQVIPNPQSVCRVALTAYSGVKCTKKCTVLVMYLELKMCRAWHVTEIITYATAHILGKCLGDFWWAACCKSVDVSKVPLRAIKMQTFLLSFRLQACWDGYKSIRCYCMLLIQPSRFKFVKVNFTA
jgi:hypothetical protein